MQTPNYRCTYKPAHDSTSLRIGKFLLKMYLINLDMYLIIPF